MWFIAVLDQKVSRSADRHAKEGCVRLSAWRISKPREQAMDHQRFRVRLGSFLTALTLMIVVPLAYAIALDLGLGSGTRRPGGNTPGLLIINLVILVLVLGSGRLILRAVSVFFNNEHLLEWTLPGQRRILWAEVTDVEVSDYAVRVYSPSAVISLKLVVLDPTFVRSILTTQLPGHLHAKLLPLTRRM